MSNAARLFKQQKDLIPLDSPVPNRRILVVDDEPEIAKGIKEVLCPDNPNVVTMRSSRRSKSEGDLVPQKASEFDVVVVNNPQDALKELESSVANKRPFAMGFFDVMLGADIDGIELAKRVMSLDPNFFVVFVTAYHDRSVDTIGTYLGNDNRERWDYINKPFNEGEILQKARNASSLWDLHRLREWQAERLSEANQILIDSERHSAMAAIGRSVAHEFGNLLTHIIGHAELATEAESMEEMKSSLEVILKAGKTAASVLKNFRNLNESGTSEKEFMVSDLKTLLQEALELMEFRFRRHGIKIHTENVESVTAYVNKNAIIQVFANLFINAIHAMDQGGELYISIKKDGGNAKIVVRDTGSGIPEEILPRVTESLFTTKGKEGSGLGLAICKEIIEIEHRGQFKVGNHPQGGAQIDLSFPIERED
ncbi:MAG: hybrid sensor histidine kinase/response regulator [Bdellovibrionales bacterium]|nr:hybrid sensor histidine kinase/response regulator [Bdellovibrionales bacterium]